MEVSHFTLEKSRQYANELYRIVGYFFDLRDDAFYAKSLGFILEDMESSLHARFDDGAWLAGLELPSGADVRRVLVSGRHRCHGDLLGRYLALSIVFFAARGLISHGCLILTVDAVVPTEPVLFQTPKPAQAGARAAG